MSGDDLAALEPRAEPDPAPEAPESDTAEVGGAAAAEALTDAEIATAIAIIVSTVGGIICSRARVAPLAPEEVRQLTDAGVKVASLYDFRADPKVMAWLGLGLTVTAVAAPRVGEFKGRKAAAIASAKAEAEAAGVPVRTVEPAASDNSDYRGGAARGNFSQAGQVDEAASAG